MKWEAYHEARIIRFIRGTEISDIHSINILFHWVNLRWREGFSDVGMSDRDTHNSDKLTSLLLFGILFFKVGLVLRRCRSLQSFAFDSSSSSGQLLKLSHEGVRVGPGSAERRITLARAIARANDILNMLGYQIHRHWKSSLSLTYLLCLSIYRYRFSGAYFTRL